MDDNAPFLDMPNNQNPEPHAKIFYGQTKVPTPINTAAMKVDHAKVMRQVMDAK